MKYITKGKKQKIKPKIKQKIEIQKTFFQNKPQEMQILNLAEMFACISMLFLLFTLAQTVQM